MDAIGNCPWCMREARISSRSAFVFCTNADCEVYGPDAATEDLAIAAWNKLAGPDVVVGRLRWEKRDDASMSLMVGNYEIGSQFVNDHAVNAWIMYGHDGCGVRESSEKARAALVDAVKAAFGGEA